MFVDQQRRPGRRLREFAILGEAEMDGCRRFQVKLSLADPDESILAAYYVFGQGPIWVYRAEDFDMIMHMDKTMMDARAAEAAAASADGRGGSRGITITRRPSRRPGRKGPRTRDHDGTRASAGGFSGPGPWGRAG